MRKAGFDVGGDRTLFVRNIPFDAEAGELESAFKAYGAVEYVKFVGLSGAGMLNTFERPYQSYLIRSE